MDNTLLAKKIADFVSEHGDEYEIKDQMDNGETRGEYISKLVDEASAMLESYDGASTLLGYLTNYLGNPEAEQASKELVNEIQETYAFKLGNIAHRYTAVELDTESPYVLDDMKAEMGIDVKDANGFAEFVHELNKINEQLLDTPEGRADMLQKAQEWEILLEGNPEMFGERITGFIQNLQSAISSLGEETEHEYIARKASELLVVPTDFIEAVKNNFEDANVRNELVAKLEAVTEYEVVPSASFSDSRLVHAETDEANAAAKLIDRVCAYEYNEFDEIGKDPMQAIIQEAMYAYAFKDNGQGRSYHSAGQYEAVKTVTQDGETALDTTCDIKLFSSHSQFADIHVDKDKADVTFLEHNILTDKMIAFAADEIGKYLKEPMFHTEYHYPQNHKDIAVEAFTPCDDDDFAIAEMDDRSLAECVDRVLISLSTIGNNYIFYDGAEFIEDHDVEVFVNRSTEQLYVSFQDGDKMYEQEVPLTPDERSLVTEKLDEYEAGKGKEDVE